MHKTPRFRATTNGFGSRPVAYLMPRPISVDDLAAIGARIVEAVGDQASDLLHVIAIAKSGYPIAVAAAMQLRSQKPAFDIYISGIDPYAPLNTFDDLPPHKACFTVMVDNSVRTGQTAVQALKVATAADLRVDQFIKLIDYDDELERESLACIKNEYAAMSICSLYSVAEIATNGAQ